MPFLRLCSFTWHTAALPCKCLPASDVIYERSQGLHSQWNIKKNKPLVLVGVKFFGYTLFGMLQSFSRIRFVTNTHTHTHTHSLSLSFLCRCCQSKVKKEKKSDNWFKGPRQNGRPKLCHYLIIYGVKSKFLENIDSSPSLSLSLCRSLTFLSSFLNHK